MVITYNLTIAVLEKDGVHKEHSFPCASELEADDKQLAELAAIKARGAKFVDAYVCRSRK